MKLTPLILFLTLCAQSAQVTTNAQVKPMLAPGTVLVMSQTLYFTPSPDTNAIGTYVYGTTNAFDFAVSGNMPTNIVNIMLEYSTSQQILAIPGITNTAQFFSVLNNIFH